MKGGSVTYPVYCFCFSKTVVHVPIGGDLKRIVILPSTGERTIVVFEVVGGAWASDGTITIKREMM